MPNLRPLKGQYIVRRADATETKIGNLFIPDQAQEKPLEGIVVGIPQIPIVPLVNAWKLVDNNVDVSPDPLVKFEETQVKVGDRVLFGKYSGIEIKFDGSPYVVLKEEDILAVVVPE